MSESDWARLGFKADLWLILIDLAVSRLIWAESNRFEQGVLAGLSKESLKFDWSFVVRRLDLRGQSGDFFRRGAPIVGANENALSPGRRSTMNSCFKPS